ncbi:lasso peptide biosynthesis PqqD family chaperone [Clostridium sp. AWRP]|uniref:lasso peptide biosynthesis PqqD family chaperone n=1 Tax=Clostridium sp. AWRP TaxID=2212991 RepID=UPI000FDCB108|nr:lasso peptide biosynthesis PqqD family chaperone [Clostridium sp. AWRP]AZV56469.1 lasso peptide biosynthesis PqqD family chaperone [Clostridium sp. AWRP]
MINEQTMIKRVKDVVSAELDDMTVMMSIENGSYYGFNEISTVIWAFIEENIKVKDLVRKLTDEFDVSTEECEKDVIKFLNELKKLNLVEIENSK